MYNQDDIVTVYSTGRGLLTVRGKAEIVEAKNGNHQIIISEMPFPGEQIVAHREDGRSCARKTIEEIRGYSRRIGQRRVTHRH